MKARTIVIPTVLAVVLGVAGAPAATAVDGFPLVVHVQTASGAPIPRESVDLLESYPGADVDADEDGDPDGLVVSGITDADGNASFADVADGVYDVTAANWRGGVQRATVTVSGGLSSLTITDPHIMKVSGTVRDGVTGTPVPAAYVSAGTLDDSQYYTTRAAADGTFSFLAGAGTHYVGPSAEGYRDDWGTKVVVVDGVDVTGVRALIYRQSHLTGLVSLGGKGRQAYVLLGGRWLRSASNGALDAIVDPGAFTASIEGTESDPYFTTYYGNTVREPDARKLVIKRGFNATLNIALVAKGQVSGTVVDRNGRPVAYQEVHAQNIGRAGAAVTTTDSYGRYTLRGLASGKVQLWAWGGTSALPAFGQRTVSLVQGTPLTGVKVTIGDDAIVYGQIRTYGSNVAYQDISLVGSSGGYYGTFRPDAEGWVGFAGLPAGTYYVHVDGSNIRKQVVVRAHQQVSFGTITRGEQVVVKGVVRTAAGKPAASALVKISDRFGMGYVNVRTNSQGAYSVKAAVSGSYTISATPKSGTDAWTIAAVTVTAGKTVVKDLRLGKGATVTGTVLNAKGGPAIGVLVETYDGRTARTNASGQYTLTGLRAAYTEIRVSDPSWVGGYRSAYAAVTPKTSMTVKVPTVTVGLTATTTGVTDWTADRASLVGDRQGDAARTARPELTRR